MFNRKLKARIKELESKLEYQNRWNDEMYNLTKRMCKRLDKIEDSKTFEYPYKYTYSDAKKEKEIPVDVRDKILNDYGKLLQRDFVFNFDDDTIKKSINAYLNKNL